MKTMYQKKNWLKYGAGFLFLGALMITLMGFVVQILWNWLIPDLFGGNVITFFQAIGLIVLGKLLTGFFNFGSHHKYRNHSMDKNNWKQKWDDKMSNMDEGEKENFKKMMYDRCNWKYPWQNEIKKDEEKNNA